LCTFLSCLDFYNRGILVSDTVPPYFGPDQKSSGNHAAGLALAMLADSQHITSPHHPETAIALFAATMPDATGEQRQQARDILQNFIDNGAESVTAAAALKCAAMLDRETMLEAQITLNKLSCAAAPVAASAPERAQSFAAGLAAGRAAMAAL
jgi:hypothetical protein